MQLILFSDLDGTLLDHQTYDFSPALPALAALRSAGIPLILASSKTGPELLAIRSALGINQWPAIVENGAGELPGGDEWVADNSEYQHLRQILDDLPGPLRRCFTGFGDMSVSDVVAHTGLSADAAQLAKQRSFTEPGLFNGDDNFKVQFIARLAENGVAARDGGRFLTLSFGRTKADGLRTIAARLGAQETIALGDAPNDFDMLVAATQAIIVRNDHGPNPGEIAGALTTRLPGPAGWNEAVLSLLDSRNIASE